MKNYAIALVLLLVLAGCSGDESVAAYGGSERTWVLESLNGTPFEARATLEFSDKGRISGQAPCNSYFAEQTAPYPWFVLEGVGATRRTCPDLSEETAFFAALTNMSQSEVFGDLLRLNNEAGDEMIFRASPPENS